MKSILLSILCFFSLWSLSGQAEEVLTFGNIQGYVKDLKIYGNKLIFYTDSYYGGRNRIVELGSHSILNSSFETDVEQGIFTDDGLFYIIYGGNWSHGHAYMGFLKPDGQLFVSQAIGRFNRSEEVAPQFLLVMNGRCYVQGENNGNNYVWESDGTEEGTKVIFETTSKITRLAGLNDKLLIVEERPDSYQLFSYEQGSDPIAFFDFDKTNFSTDFKKLGDDGNALYFSVVDTSDYYTIWKSDLTKEGTDLFSEGYQATEIEFSPNSFMVGNEKNGKITYFKGLLDAPNEIVRVPFTEKYDSPTATITARINPQNYLFFSVENGYEFAYLSPEDTLVVMDDLARGPNASIAYLTKGYSPFLWANLDSKISPQPDGSIYFTGTNGKDADYYTYELKDNHFQSLFKMQSPDEVNNYFVYDEYLYWFEGGGSDLKLRRRKRTNTDVPQSDMVDEHEYWYRQFAVYDPIIHTYNFGLELDPIDVQIDEDQNVFVSFSHKYGYNIESAASSDTDQSIEVKTNFLYVKYDKYGHFQWANSIGDDNWPYEKGGKFVIDNEGNLLVLGKYYKNGIFDDVSLTSPQGELFLTKLDKDTGKVLWVKNLAKYQFANDIYPDALTTDEQGNIYIGVTYELQDLILSGITLHSDESNMTTVAKFSPDGLIIWANNMEQSGRYGFRHVSDLQYDYLNKRIILAQGEGSYNTSSFHSTPDWYYLIQGLDNEGNIVESENMKGTDIGALTAGTISGNGTYYGFGFFKGWLNFKNYDLLAPSYGGFTFINGTNGGNTLFEIPSDSAAFYPLDAAYSDGFVYVLGETKYRLLLIKYTADGNYVGYRKINQYTDVFDSEEEYSIAVKNGFIVLIGENFRRDVEMGITPLINYMPSISILKFEDANWRTDDLWGIVPDPAIIPADKGFGIYPNPFTQFINIVFEQDAIPYSKYEIVNVNGMILRSGDLSQNKIQRLYLPDLPKGTYFLRLSGKEKVETVKVVKV